MDARNPADELPDLYRKVLDALARLEAAGDRATAYDLRVDAQRAYARNWNERGRRTLQRIARDADARARAAEGRRGARDPEAAVDLLAETA
jgi:hypothetical protein